MSDLNDHTKETLQKLSRKSIQELAKKNSVKANNKTEEIIKALLQLQSKEAVIPGADAVLSETVAETDASTSTAPIPKKKVVINIKAEVTGNVNEDDEGDATQPTTKRRKISETTLRHKVTPYPPQISPSDSEEPTRNDDFLPVPQLGTNSKKRKRSGAGDHTSHVSKTQAPAQAITSNSPPTNRRQPQPIVQKTSTEQVILILQDDNNKTIPQTHATRIASPPSRSPSPLAIPNAAPSSSNAEHGTSHCGPTLKSVRATKRHLTTLVNDFPTLQSQISTINKMMTQAQEVINEAKEGLGRDWWVTFALEDSVVQFMKHDRTIWDGTAFMRRERDERRWRRFVKEQRKKMDESDEEGSDSDGGEEIQGDGEETGDEENGFEDQEVDQLIDEGDFYV